MKWTLYRIGWGCTAWLLMAVAAVASLIPNGGFEDGLAHWSALWTREENAGNATVVQDVVHDGLYALKVEHEGDQDWSIGPQQRIAVAFGDIFDFSAWLKTEGTGSGEICVVLYGPDDQVVDWTFAIRSLRGTHDWTSLETGFVVPRNVTRILPRLIGWGAATVWLDEFTITFRTNIVADLPEQMTLANAVLNLVFSPSNATFSVTDKRNGQVWTQKPLFSDVYVTAAEHVDNRIRVDALHADSGIELTLELRLIGDLPEAAVSILADGEMPNGLVFPQPFASGPGNDLVVPMNEGIAYPVDDPSIEPMRLVAYGGHGICMPFWGVTDGDAGHMAIIETADDAMLAINRHDGLLYAALIWQPQMGRFGYEREVRYCFFDHGGHVAMAKRYRQHAVETGLFKTLAQKRAENPNVDKLVGAANIWTWESDALAFAHEMRQMGMSRLLWSNGQHPDVLRQLNDLGILTSRYDIFQDVMDPAQFDRLDGIHPDWPTEAWPDDIMLDENGDWIRGWEVTARDGSMIPTGVLCDHKAPDIARARISNELTTHPYQCRFIDATTATPWRECYHPDHSHTRTESRVRKMELLDVVSREAGLVCGSETGHDAAVPFAHYFEGMLSLAPYRVPDSGRGMLEPWLTVPENVAKFQVGHAYRLPLWELVYHDCLVAHWYWGDYNNKLPDIWDKRDLFNILYGTPPMFMFDRVIWSRNKNRFRESYDKICPLVRAVGYMEMTDHRFLTEDRSVQQTVFGNAVTVTVNFVDNPYLMNNGRMLPGMNYAVEGLDLDGLVLFPEDPNDCAPIPIIYEAHNGPLKNASNITAWVRFMDDTPFVPHAMTPIGDGAHRVVLAAPDNAPGLSVYFQSEDGTATDDRGGSHWFCSMRDCEALPLFGAAHSAVRPACEPVTVEYRPNDGPLRHAFQVYAHAGFNGWQRILFNQPMTRVSNNLWRIHIQPPPHAAQLNIVFHDGHGTWDNNTFADWRFTFDPCSVPQIGLPMSTNNGAMIIHWPSAGGHRYCLEYKDDLSTPGPFLPLITTTNLAPDGALENMQFTDDAARHLASRFYRVRHIDR